MFSRIVKRSYHMTGKFTHQEAVTNFIIKSIENTNYNVAIDSLTKHSKNLSRSNINTISKTLENNQTTIFMKLYGYVIFGQAMCVMTDNYAIFPMVVGSYNFILDCTDHQKLEDIVKSADFDKQLESDDMK